MHQLITSAFQDPEAAKLAIYHGFWLSYGPTRPLSGTPQAEAELLDDELQELRPCSCHRAGTPDKHRAVGVRFSTVASKILAYGKQHKLLKNHSLPFGKQPSTKVGVHQIAILVHHTMTLKKPLIPLLEGWMQDATEFWVLHRCGNGMIPGLTCTEPSHLVFGNSEQNEEHKHFHWASKALLKKKNTAGYAQLRALYKEIKSDDLFRRILSIV